MERRQGTLDQVFRARKRKHTSPVTSSSKSKKKNNHDGASGETPEISPSRKCSLEAFLFNAKVENPPASTGAPSGAVPEPELPELRRGEVKFSSNKPWLTPCSLASRPASAEAKKEDGSGSVERPDADRSSASIPLKTQISQPLPSPVKTQLIFSETRGGAEEDRGREFSGTGVEAIHERTDNSVDKKTDGAGNSHLSQIANEFLALCFSGITPSNLSKSQAAEHQQKRKDEEGLSENAGRKKVCPESAAPTETTQDLSDLLGSAPTRTEQTAVLGPEPRRSSSGNEGETKEKQVERQVRRGREYCSDFNEDDDPLQGNSAKCSSTTHSDKGALSQSPGASHVSPPRSSRSYNLSLGGQRAPVGLLHDAAISAGDHESRADSRIAGFKFDPGGGGLGIKHASTPPEAVLSQPRQTAAGGEEGGLRNPNTTASGSSEFLTPSGKESLKSLSFGHVTEAALVTPESCSENKHESASSNECNAGASFYRSTNFSPGDDFWEEAIEIVMASKVDMQQSAAEKSNNQTSSPGKRSESDIPTQPPKISKGVLKHPVPSSHGHVLSRQQLHPPPAKLQPVSQNDSNRMPTSGKKFSPAVRSTPWSAEERQEQAKSIQSQTTPSKSLQKSTRDGVGVEARLKQFRLSPVSPLPVRHFDFASKGDNADHRIFQDVSQKKNNALPVKTPVKEVARMTSKSVRGVAPAVTESPPQETRPTPPLAVPSVVETPRALTTEVDKGGEVTAAGQTQRQTAKVVTGEHTKIAPAEALCQAGGETCSDISSGVITDQRNLELSDWLPKEVADVYAKKGLTRMYPWQLECIRLGGVLNGKNLVYCASTSAGKSLVAELLMLRRVISTGRMALLVLPFVSICTEKAEHLGALLEPLGKRVRNFFGTQGGGTVPKDTAIAVCTIEKANSLINKLLEENRLSEICLIVIDELHMVGDRDRGYLLELVLTKIRYACGEFDRTSQERALANSLSQTSSKGEPKSDLQVIGMSATMSNIGAVAHWLQAALYETQFRPVPLEEFVKIGNMIYTPNMEVARIIRKEAAMGGKDPDHVIELCSEVVRDGHSVLVFCSGRKACETSAIHIAKYLPSRLLTPRNGITFSKDGVAAIEELRKSTSGLDPVLAQTLPFGVAYHHAGLTVEEREIVEKCFKDGVVRVLTATSTLAAGVNLPARRVIFRQPRIGADFLDAIKYRQMAGRAGRAGIDTKGESVLICKPEEAKRMLSIISKGCVPLQSCLTGDKMGMTRALLEVVAGGMVQTGQDVNRYVRCTLFNSTESFERVVKSVKDSLWWLQRKKFLGWNSEAEVYCTTALGRATFGSSLAPDEALVVYEDIAKARDNFTLSSDLHLVYLVTPTSVDLEPDWSLFYQKFVELTELEQLVAAKVGVAEPFLMRMAHGGSMGSASKPKGIARSPPKRGVTSPALHGTVEGKFTGRHQTVDALRVCRRFYVALMLHKLVQEMPVMEVADAFRVPRGKVQTLQQNSGRFAGMVLGFCERLGFQDVEGLVAKFQSRVSFGVKSEIVELTEIPFVKAARARALYKAGFRTVQAVAEATIPELVKALSETSAWAAQDDPRRHTQYRVLTGVARKIKAGAQRIVFDTLEEARLAHFSAMRALGVAVPPAHWPQLILPSIEFPSAGLGDDAVDGSGEPVAVNDDRVVDQSRQRMDVSNNSHFQTPQSNVEGHGTTLPRPDVTNVTAAEQHLESGREGAVPEQGDENQMGGKLQNVVVDRRGGANAESVIQKYKKAAGSTLNLNCLFGGAEFLREESLPTNRPETVERQNSGPVDVDKMSGGFDGFLEQWSSREEFCFELNFKDPLADTVAAEAVEIEGMAICWKDSPVYYVGLSKSGISGNGKPSGGNLPNEKIGINVINSHLGDGNPPAGSELEGVRARWKKIDSVLSRLGSKKVGWNLKSQLRALRRAGISQLRGKPELFRNAAVASKKGNSLHSLSPILLGEPYADIQIAAWLLWPDEESSQNLSLEMEAKKRLPGEVAARASRDGRWTNQMGQVANNGCCRRVAQIQALHANLWKLLISEGLHHPLQDIEMPMVKVLEEMESSGIGVDMDTCRHIRQVIEKRIQALEARAHQLAGTPFALTVPAEVANTLYKHLKLPVPPGCKKGKQHPSTNKHALDLLRQQHPIAAVIQEHRKLFKLLHSTLASVVIYAKSPAAAALGASGVKEKSGHDHHIFGRWLQTSTATGRLSMEEPNLQCVENTICFAREDDAAGAANDKVEICTRRLFVPTQERWVILSADYSQIEVRLMAHFSEDAGLIALLSKPSGDLFRMISSQWTGCAEAAVTEKQREQTKRLVYGILYGMGAHALAEQLECSVAEASLHLEKFRSAFPGVTSWLQQACVACRKSGYVTTLGGRKRYLDKINSGTHAEQAKAERQAVNSICQGSAADLIKMAMINLRAVTVGDAGGGNGSIVKGRCRLLLQIHDELVLEVDKLFVREVSQTLRSCMEGAAPLKVPVRVNLQVGKTWGSLNPLNESSLNALLS